MDTIVWASGATLEVIQHFIGGYGARMVQISSGSLDYLQYILMSKYIRVFHIDI